MWAGKKLNQINECQTKLFGNETEITREFKLDMATQEKIIENYFNENSEFKEAYESYMKTCHTENEIEVFYRS
ncbi:unnamed protein product [Meloidogyne enterolobii]|uniref:Uncharacterized protein n=1 Tax=Meloidogyne enterolobii TaxID=390850 RepID=A0ACB1AS61_MELEN